MHVFSSIIIISVYLCVEQCLFTVIKTIHVSTQVTQASCNHDNNCLTQSAAGYINCEAQVKFGNKNRKQEKHTTRAALWSECHVSKRNVAHIISK